jgi:RimJ/RimL family protein N-acetyltransferase
MPAPKNGELIGGSGIDRIQPKNCLGNLYYWTRTSRTRKRAATASASALAPFGLNEPHLIRIEIVVAETNLGARSVAEKICASLEIRLPNRLLLGGEILHVYLYPLLGPRPER